jgi:hypothetical protein
MSQGQCSPFYSQTGPLLFLVGIFFSNILARVILSPLMPAIEKDLNIGHGGSGYLFSSSFSLGYCGGIIGLGVRLFSPLPQKKTIFSLIALQWGFWGSSFVFYQS